MKGARLERLYAIQLHLYDILEKIKLWGRKTNRSLLPGAGEGRVDYERSQGMLHILTVGGLDNYMHLSEFIDLYTKKGEFYCT